MFTVPTTFTFAFERKAPLSLLRADGLQSRLPIILIILLFILSIHSLLSSSLRKVRAVTVSPRKLSRMLRPAPPSSSRFPLSTLPFTPRSRKEWADASGQVEFPRVKWSPACRGQCPRRIVVVVSRSCVIQI